MQKKTSSVIKTVGFGMLAGGATAAMGSLIMGTSNHKYRKMMNKAAKTAGNVIDSISNTFGM